MHFNIQMAVFPILLLNLQIIDQEVHSTQSTFNVIKS